ncbi:protein phosphatase 1 regulatory subunit 3B-like [Acropora millepora]|uniref:protein phosphatase 1 regulatory subunit 3B-like n=1 Tax=Acropora millepora TaxID=45264 RepID=UPI0010FCC5B6|nr:protein phosphatase 1 regulatory subunit 3B-like [Acropora millepora]
MAPTQSLKSCDVELKVGCSKSDTELSKKDRRVYFADSIGLSLVSVFYLPTTAPKRFPSRRWSSIYHAKGELLNFTQPLKSQDFNERLNQSNVCLENIFIKDSTVNGSIKVRNLSYDKKITVRYTIDGWSSHQDVVAWYIQGLHTGLTDTFGFEIALPTMPIKDCKLEFAICYRFRGIEFWDNNSGDNYRLLCYSSLTRWRCDNGIDYFTQHRYVGLRS